MPRAHVSSIPVGAAECPGTEAESGVKVGHVLQTSHQGDSGGWVLGIKSEVNEENHEREWETSS